jgi:hypothetical protein
MGNLKAGAQHALRGGMACAGQQILCRTESCTALQHLLEALLRALLDVCTHGLRTDFLPADMHPASLAALLNALLLLLLLLGA